MKQSLFFGPALMTLAACASNALGESLTALGSMICDSTRTALVAIDASYTLTDNNDKLIFCAAAQDDDCRPDGGSNSCSLEYRELAGSWATVPTSNAGGPSLASSGTSLSNNSTVSTSERRCNSASQFRASAKEFTTSTSLAYSMDWRDKNSEAQWALDFSTDPGGKTYEFRVKWQTSDCGTVTITYPAQITTFAGISHHWDLDETTGTTAADSIGSSDGTLWGFPGDDSQWTCSNGGSLTFDGVDDYVSLPTESDYDFTSAVTVAAWIQVTSFGAAEQAIVTKGDTAWRLERNASTNTVQFAVDGLTTNTVVQGSVSVNDGGWHHVAGVYDGSDLLLYVDGVLDNSVNATGTMDENSASVYIGDNAEVAGRYFHGRMDDVYIYDTALTPAEVLALAQQSMLGWWKLDETSGTNANDDSAYANDGTLTNMAGTEWTPGKVDNGLDLDGSADYIETGIASNLATTATMMAWFKSDDAGLIGDDFVEQRFLTQRDTGTSSRLAVGINLDRIAVFYDNGGNVTQEGTTPLVADVWYHAAVTYDGATVRLYLNGVEENNWASGSLSTPSADNFQIGCNYAATRLFDGMLDDVRLYSRALCATEVAAIYAQGAGGVRIVSWKEVDPFP